MEKNTDNMIELKKIKKSFDGFLAVDEFNLTVKRGEFITLLGPSGCGKTTTLRMIAGFELPSEGSILLNGDDISVLPPNKRPINTVFQRYALFPHLNVYENIAFGLKLKIQEVTYKNQTGETQTRKEKLSKTVISEKVKRALEIVDLEGFEKRDVSTLSGGQQQRIAIARAIVNEPEILLLDEPLGALDLKMRKEMQLELKSMHERLGITFIYVTHDQEEALTMSDKVVVMSNGMIQQIGTPEEIYNEPKTVFVADFIGESNIFNGKMTGKKLVQFCGVEFQCVDDLPIGAAVDVVVRPEDVQFVEKEKAALFGTVQSVIFKGMHYEITVISGDNEIVVKTTKMVNTGIEIGLTIEPDGIHVIHADTSINHFNGVITAENKVLFADGEFEFNPTQFVEEMKRIDQSPSMMTDKGLRVGEKVLVKVPATSPTMSDDSEKGNTRGHIVSLIYKGDHYHYIVRTKTGEEIHLHDQDLWNENDYVSVSIPKESIRITLGTDKE